jgi:Flp pilus assembly protein TadG
MRTARNPSVPGRPARRGTAAVEFAVIAPIFMTMLLGLIEFGRAFMVLETLNNCARVGARTGALSGNSSGAVTAAVNNALSASGISSATVNVTVNGQAVDASTAVSGDTLAVAVSVPYSQVSWLPGSLFLGGATLTGNVAMRRE